MKILIAALLIASCTACSTFKTVAPDRLLARDMIVTVIKSPEFIAVFLTMYVY